MRQARVVALIVAAAAGAAPVSAEVALDGSLGPAGALTGPDFRVDADLGQQVGSNLFHSFSRFDLASGESATFSGPETVSTIVGRVTGGAASSIDGTVRSTIPGAGLYLLNPAGVLFGPNASLETNGSFHVSSADYLGFTDGTRFATGSPAPPVLTSALPSAFGFLSGSPAPLTARQSSLGVPEGRQVSLVGGDITLDRATVFAPAGRIDVVAVSGTGEVVPTQTDLDADAVSSLGTIKVAEDGVADRPVANGQALANVDASGRGGGQIFLRGGAIVLAGAEVFADTLGDAPGRGVDVFSTGDIVLTSGARLTSDSFGAGAAGDVTVRANGALRLADSGSAVASNSRAGGDGGTVTVHAARVELDDASLQVAAARTGNGGDLVIETGTLIVRNGGAIQTDAGPDSTGDAGDVQIRASHSVSLMGRNENERTSGIFANTLGAGSGGRLEIATPLLELSDRAAVLGRSSLSSTGPAGDVVIRVERLEISGGSRIDTRTVSDQAAGTINVVATDSIVVSGTDTRGNPSQITSATDVGAGSGGEVTLEAPAIFVDNGAEVSVSSGGAGDAGDIRITTAGLTVQDASLSSAAKRAAGGRIVIAAAGTVALVNARIITALNGRTKADDAGDISIARPTFVILDSSRMSANAVIGNGGNVRISSKQLIASPNSEVTASSELGIDGTIVIDSLTADITAGVTVLDSDFLNAAALLRTACGKGGVRDVSTFARTGRGGVPLPPHEWMSLPRSVSGDARPGGQAAASPPARSARRSDLVSTVDAPRSECAAAWILSTNASSPQ